jgi:enhancer of mRNA-decapping protein 4
MYSQIASQAPSPEASQASAGMSARLDSMARAVEALTAEVIQLRAVVKAQGAGTDTTRGMLVQQRQQVDPMEEMRHQILTLLQARNYEKAFTVALSASTADMAVFCCRHANLSDCLGGSTPGVSQPILLCLMQQLGANIASSSSADLQTELAWLQEIALILDPSDHSIVRHAPKVLHQLEDNINAKMAEGDPTLRRPLQMLLQVIRGMAVHR